MMSAMVVLRVLVIFRRKTKTTEHTEEEDDFDPWLIKRFPTVEKRARAKGMPALSPNDAEWIRKEFTRPLRDRLQKRHGKAFIALSIAYEGQTEVVSELLDEIENIVHVANERYDSLSLKDCVLALLARAIPFGSPTQTLPNVLCNDFEYARSEEKCALPNTAGRALPSWFPSPVRSHERPLQRITATIMRPPEVVVWVEDVVNAILYRHEAEFKNERDIANHWSVSSNVYCNSHLRQPAEVTVFAKSDVAVQGVHDCVQRVEKDDRGFRIVMIPPPPLELKGHPSSFVTARFVSDSYSPPLPDPLHRSTGDNAVDVINPLSRACPLRATYRLRQAGLSASSTSSLTQSLEYQLVARISTNVDHKDRPAFAIKHLRVRLLMPSAVSITQIKVQASSGSVLHGDNIIDWEIGDSVSTTSGTALLSGIVFCRASTAEEAQSNLQFHGETSCAFIDFELHGARAMANPACSIQALEVNGNQVSVNPDLRVAKSGKFVVWNPFGNFPKGIPVDVLYNCLGDLKAASRG